MKRLLVAMIVIAVIFTTLLFIRCNKERSTDGRTEQISYRIKWLPNANYIDGYIAVRKGFFSVERLSCTVRPGGPDLDSIKLVASGTDNFGVTGADQLLLARRSGIPVIAVAALFQQSPVCFITRARYSITQPQEFKGKTVGIKPGTNTETEYLALLARNRIQRSTITEVPIKFDMSPFFSDKVNVWPGYESNEALTAKQKDPSVHIFLAREHGIDTYGNVIITSERMLRDHPGTVRRFLRAIIKAWRFAAEHPEEAVEILVQAEPKLDKQKELEGLHKVLPLVLGRESLATAQIGQMTLNRWRASQQVLIDAGLDMIGLKIENAFTTSMLAVGGKK